MESPSGRSCVGSAQRIDFFGGHIDIVDISSIYRRFRRPSDRLDIVDISTIYRRYIDDILAKCNSFIDLAWLCVQQGAQALRAAISRALGIRKHNTTNPMQHCRSTSLRDHPLGAPGRLPVLKGLLWSSSSRRPMPVQRRVMCCMLAQNAIKLHRVGT